VSLTERSQGLLVQETLCMLTGNKSLSVCALPSYKTIAAVAQSIHKSKTPFRNCLTEDRHHTKMVKH
jgi:hypothetical protein